MDLNTKIDELKQEIIDLMDEEKQIKLRLASLKQLVEEKKRRSESVKLLKVQEEELLKELGLL